MTTYVVNKQVTKYTYSTQAFMSWGPYTKYQFSTYSGVEGIPSEMTVQFWLDSYGASGSNMAYVYMNFYDEAGNRLLQVGHTTVTTSMSNVTRTIVVPPGTAYFSTEAKIRAFTYNRVNRDGRGEIEIIDMTYSAPVAEPKIEEVDITTSVRAIVTNIRRALETVANAIVEVFKTETVVEVKSNSYSHVEPLRAAATKHALAVTTTKGSKISTIVFTNVKTATSSLIEPIDAHNVSKAMRRREVVTNSSMKNVLTSATVTASVVKQLTSHVKAVESVSEAMKKSQFSVASHTRPVYSNNSASSVRLELQALPVNKVAFSASMNLVAFTSRGSSYLKFSDYSGIAGVPTEMNFLLSLMSDASGSDRASVRVHFFDVNKKLIPGNGLVVTSPGIYADVPYRAIVPPNADTFYIEAYFRNYYQASKQSSASAKIVDMTYLMAPEPEAHEVTVTSYSAPIISASSGGANRESIVNSAFSRFYSEASAQRSPGRTIESSSESITQRSFIKTETHVKTSVQALTSSAYAKASREVVIDSHVLPIRSEKEVMRSYNRAAESFIGFISSRAAVKATAQATSLMQSLTSITEADNNKESNATSTVSRIFVETIVQRIAKRAPESSVASIHAKRSIAIASGVKSSLQGITSSAEVDSQRVRVISIDSHMRPLHSETSSRRKYERFTESSVHSLTSRAVITGATQTTSSIQTITTETSEQIIRQPAHKLIAVNSHVGSISSHNNVSREVVLHSYINKGFSRTLLSYQADVVSAIPKITSGAALQRSKGAAFEVILDYGITLAHNISTERRQLKMRLNELKLRLKIPPDDTKNDELLLIYLDDALDFIQRTCNQIFDPLPPTAKKVATQYVAFELNGNGYVLSESISGMSQTYESSEKRDKSLTDTLRKAGLIKLRFM
ncbi:phage head-tail connector protein [Solibacillus silvestris]